MYPSHDIQPSTWNNLIASWRIVVSIRNEEDIRKWFESIVRNKKRKTFFVDEIFMFKHTMRRAVSNDNTESIRKQFTK